MSVKTILVIGASGFLGSNVVLHLRKKYKVIAAFHEKIVQYPGVSHVMYSLTDRDYMKRMFMLMKPDFVIYCAGMTDFMECARNPQAADLVNNFGPVAVSAAGDTTPHRLISLSSAYVYDGKKGNFSESDVMFPETQFGKGKLSGENFIRSKSSMYTILRFSPLIGTGTIYHPSLIDKIRMKLQLGERVELPQNEFHSFLSIDIAIKAIEWVIVNESRNNTYNLGGLTKVSWFEFGQMFAERMGFDPALVMPGKGQLDAGGDFSINGSEFIAQSEINPLLLEESLDLFKKQLIR